MPAYFARCVRASLPCVYCKYMYLYSHVHISIHINRVPIMLLLQVQLKIFKIAKVKSKNDDKVGGGGVVLSFYLCLSCLNPKDRDLFHTRL